MPNRFELVERVGRGGMGVVWRARDTDTGQIVALKVIHAMYADDPDYLARFEREVEVVRRIDSPNVVKVLGYGQQDGLPYMAMEYVEGQSLKDVIKERGKLSWTETRAIMLQVAEGLAAAHGVGVIHRDVKPSNILLTKDGTAKLADFGIARASDLTALTGSSTMLGTPHYMAPEGSPSAQSDLYSLGCVAYEALAGRPVFEGESQHQVLTQHLREAPDLGRLPRVSRRIVGRLIAKKPADRAESAAALAELLRSKKGELRGIGAPPLWAILGAPAAVAAGVAIVFGARWQSSGTKTSADGSGALVASTYTIPTPTPATPTVTPTAPPVTTDAVSTTVSLLATRAPTTNSTASSATATPRPPTPTATPRAPTPTPAPPKPTPTPAPWDLLPENTISIASMTRGTGNNYNVTIYYRYTGARTDISVFPATAGGCTDAFGHIVDVYFSGVGTTQSGKSGAIPAGKAGPMGFQIRPSVVRTSSSAVTCTSITFATNSSELAGATWSSPVAFNP